MSNYNRVWRPIKNYEGLYEISNFGVVKSLERFYSGRLNRERFLRNTKDKDGYLKVCLLKNGEMKTFKTHRLVASAFLLNPENKPQVNHKDGNKANNFLRNLEWVTRSENQKHAFKIGLSSNDSRKLKVIQTKNGGIIKIWNSIREAANHLEISNSNISSCCNGRVKSAGGFGWKFFKAKTATTNRSSSLA